MAAKQSKHAKSGPKRKKPARLAQKLLAIRLELGLSQGGLISRLGLDDQIGRDYVSKFERGILEPTLDVLLAYARAVSTSRAGLLLEALIDDEMDLPNKISSAFGTTRKSRRLK